MATVALTVKIVTAFNNSDHTAHANSNCKARRRPHAEVAREALAHEAPAKEAPAKEDLVQAREALGQWWQNHDGSISAVRNPILPYWWVIRLASIRAYSTDSFKLV